MCAGFTENATQQLRKLLRTTNKIANRLRKELKEVLVSILLYTKDLHAGMKCKPITRHLREIVTSPPHGGLPGDVSDIHSATK